MMPDQDAVRAARRVAAVHRRRRSPNRRACAACLWPWTQGQTRGGRPSGGCASRLRALEVLDGAGLLDDCGRPIDPGSGER